MLDVDVCFRPCMQNLFISILCVMFSLALAAIQPQNTRCMPFVCNSYQRGINLANMPVSDVLLSYCFCRKLEISSGRFARFADGSAVVQVQKKHLKSPEVA